MMKKTQEGIQVVGVLLSLIASAHAGVIFSDSFGYPNGNLAGQGGWGETSGAGVNPIQVFNQSVSLAGAGQDVAHALAVGRQTGPSFYIGVDVSLSVAKDPGEYFLHLSSRSGHSDRLYAKRNDNATFFLGLSPGGSITPAYGTTPLNNSQDYRLVIAYNFGSPADNVALFVNPSGSSDTPYVMATGGALTSATAIGLRQGGENGAPSVVLDKLVVSDSFLEAVPEPSTYLAGGFAVGLLALTFGSRSPRRRSGWPQDSRARDIQPSRL